MLYPEGLLYGFHIFFISSPRNEICWGDWKQPKLRFTSVRYAANPIRGHSPRPPPPQTGWDVSALRLVAFPKTSDKLVIRIYIKQMTVPIRTKSWLIFYLIPRITPSRTNHISPGDFPTRASRRCASTPHHPPSVTIATHGDHLPFADRFSPWISSNLLMAISFDLLENHHSLKCCR